MSTFVVKHLVEKRNGRFAYRRRVPAEVKDLVGKGEWKHAYPKGTTLASAQATTIKYDQEHDAELKIARSKLGMGTPNDDEITPEIYQAAVDYVQGQGLVGKRNLIKGTSEHVVTLADVWAEEHTTEEHEAGPDGYLTSYKWDSPFSRAVFYVLDDSTYPEDRDLLLGAVFKLDLDAREVTEDKPLHYAVQSFIDLIGDIDIRDITWLQAKHWTKVSASKSKLKPGTIGRRVGALKAMIGRAYRMYGVTKDNPFTELRVKRGASSEDRLPFSKDHLDCIEDHLAKSRVNEEVITIIEALKYTGARLSEITGLEVSDVKLDAKVPYILIRSNSLRELKTKTSNRTVPVNARLKNKLASFCGEKAETDALFSCNNRATNNISAKINKAIRAAGVPNSPKLVGYSFRHTVKEAMRAADVPLEDQLYLLGHSDLAVASRYGSPRKDLKKLKRHMDSAIRKLGSVPEGTHDNL